jgi:iron complex outermembrane receptor protein
MVARSLCGIALTLGAAVARADPPDYQTVVTAATPLHGSGLPRDRLPSNVQTATGEEVAANRGPDVADYLATSMGSVNVNQVQNNPLQSDTAYRGFVASPILGTPQGVSVYLDGVRFNEPFGDTVNWDLLPSQAIASVNLIPGSNPLFGLNTLGGALSLETKTGFAAPGASVELLAGSFGRRQVGFQLGSSHGPFAGYVAGDIFGEDGWRPDSASDARRLFADATYDGERTRVDLGLVAAESTLRGNGPAPIELLAADRAAVFTHPDITSNRLLMPTLRLESRVSADARLSVVAYGRDSRIDTANGDQARWAPCPDQPSRLCANDDQGGQVPLADSGGRPVAVDPDRPYDAADNRTHTGQHGYGGAVQLVLEPLIAGRENHLFLGASLDGSRDRFSADSRLARLDATRGTVPTDVVSLPSRVAVDATRIDLGLFASDTFALRRDLFLTASGRYNHSSLSLEDQLGGDLGGDHRFARLNGAGGVSWQPQPALGLFAGYSESARTPTALELTCASPDAPCRLPNAFVADPPLAMVVARTVEAGARGSSARRTLRLDYDAAFFDTANRDDILFVSAGPLTNEGYFTNVGDTRRRGVEAGLRARVALGQRGSSLVISARYTYLAATFGEDFLASSPNHPQAEGGQIAVHAGARLPGVPRHIVKGTVAFGWRQWLSVAADLTGASGVQARGDEANLLAPVPGYLVVNLRATLQLGPSLALFAKVANAFDRAYSTFGVLGRPADVLGPSYQDPRFEAPAPPRAGWAGVDLRY